MKETRKIDALTMGLTPCCYGVALNGDTIEFTSTAFMLWSGLHDFLNTFYAGWEKCSYSGDANIVGVGTIYNR